MMVLSRSKNAATRPRCECGCGCEDACGDCCGSTEDADCGCGNGCCCWDWSAVLWGSCIGTCRKKSVVGAVLGGAVLVGAVLVGAPLIAAVDVIDGVVVARAVACYLLLSPVV